MLSRSIADQHAAHMPAEDFVDADSRSERRTLQTRTARWLFRLLAAALIAALITYFSETASFGDRLWEMTWHTTLGDARNSPHAELSFKTKLAEQKYGADAEKVFQSYGNDKAFHQLLYNHGEHVVPVVAFFMENDLPSMRFQYGLGRSWDWLKQRFPWRDQSPELPVTKEYSPYQRGLYAIDRANSEGHDFIGQFDLDGQKAHWNQTDRFSKAITSFLLDGIRTVEQKRNTGAQITAWDWANAGSDVLVIFSASKLMKLPKAMPSAAQSAARITGMGQALGSNTLARKLFIASARVGVAYLIATNPSLLTGLFVDIAEALGIPAWWVVAAGWFAVVLLLSFLLLPLLAAASFLIPVIKLISGAARWLQPQPRMFQRAAQSSKRPGN